MNVGPATKFVLVNDNAGDDVTDDFLTKTAAAIDHVLTHSFRDAWGGQYSCRAGSPTLGPGEVKVSLQADSSVQGAAGYHDDGGIYCFRDGLPSLLTGAFAYSIVISHEIFETAVDPGANRWADDGQGREVALEACDAVEGFFFTPTGFEAAVSDFLYPAFFDPGGLRPFSRLDKPTSPLTTAADAGADYQIVRTVDENGIQQVTAVGQIHSLRTKAKAHPSSRTSRRGAWAAKIAREAPTLPDPSLGV
jgi:hypothetical protein